MDVLFDTEADPLDVARAVIAGVEHWIVTPITYSNIEGVCGLRLAEDPAFHGPPWLGCVQLKMATHEAKPVPSWSSRALDDLREHEACLSLYGRSHRWSDGVINAVISLGTPSDLTVVVEHLREELGLQIDLGGSTSDA